jgi:diguanylate cyclase (GGDEF)-like protein/PAS domain S-box-containing protein
MIGFERSAGWLHGAAQRAPFLEMTVGIVLFATACISILLTKAPGEIALFWPGSVIAAGLLIRSLRVCWVCAAICVLLSLVLANCIAGGRSWTASCWFAAVDFVEIVFMVAAFRVVWPISFPAATIAEAALMTVILGIAIPGGAAAAGGLVLMFAFGIPWLDGATQWWSSHTVGACLLGPPLFLFSSARIRQLASRAYFVENGLTLLIGLLGCYLAIRYIRFPFVCMGFLLMVAAFRLGGFGVSLMSLAFGLLITNFWIVGIRPMGLDPATATSLSLLGLPVVALLATVMPPIAVGLGSDARRVAAFAKKRAEQSLAVERELLKITLGSLNDAVITTDASARITYINDAAEQLFGLSRQTVTGRRVDEVIHLMDPDSTITAPNLIGLSALHGEVFRREKACVLHKPDGSVCYILDVASPVLDATGAVSAVVVVFRDTTTDVDRLRELQHRAMHDPLTGLANRAEFKARLSGALDKARYLDRPAAVIAIDLDRFKAVNDTGGHAAGDLVLCKVAEVLRSAVRASDGVARLGGDEFAIVLENCAADRANSIAEKILRMLNPLTVHSGGIDYSVGASMGLAMCKAGMPDHTVWLKAADEACYTAKKEGRGRLSNNSPNFAAVTGRPK